jgi:hypothetical protein
MTLFQSHLAGEQIHESDHAKKSPAKLPGMLLAANCNLSRNRRRLLRLFHLRLLVLL